MWILIIIALGEYNFKAGTFDTKQECLKAARNSVTQSITVWRDKTRTTSARPTRMGAVCVKISNSTQLPTDD